MVHRIRPNGDLVIAGNDEVHLVGGKEYIRIAGIVRPEDLSGNVVLSTRMAEAHIEFSGDGETYLAAENGLFAEAVPDGEHRHGRATAVH